MRGEAEVKKLEVGDLTAKDLPVIVFDHPALKALGDFFGRPLDGIIGFTFFARYKTTIDYQATQMTFEPVDFEVRNLMKDLPDRLAGPKVARSRVLAPGGLWGLSVGEAADGVDVARRARSGPSCRTPPPRRRPEAGRRPDHRSTAAGPPPSPTSTPPPPASPPASPSPSSSSATARNSP